jgi:hypothetical protein
MGTLARRHRPPARVELPPSPVRSSLVSDTTPFDERTLEGGGFPSEATRGTQL